MILLNATFCVDEPLESELVDFLKQKYIGTAYAAGLYRGLLTKIRAPHELNSISGNYTVSYALQLRAPSDAVADNFSTRILPELLAALPAALQQAVNIYCTELDIIHDPDRDGERY